MFAFVSLYCIQGYQLRFTGPHLICAEPSEISLMCVAVNVVNKFLFGNSIVCLTGPREQSRGFGWGKNYNNEIQEIQLEKDENDSGAPWRIKRKLN